MALKQEQAEDDFPGQSPNQSTHQQGGAQEQANDEDQATASEFGTHPSNVLPKHLRMTLAYQKEYYASFRGPQIHLGDDPEPLDTVYDTTLNPITEGPYWRRLDDIDTKTDFATLFLSRNEHNASQDKKQSQVKEKMLNASQIKEFLTENVDEHATHFVFMTIYGTLLANDDFANVKATRRFTAFVGTAWRLHNSAITETGKASPYAEIFNGKALKLIVKADGKGIKTMFVEQEGLVSAVILCSDNFLLAAQRVKGAFAGELDELEGGPAITNHEEDGVTMGVVQKEGDVSGDKDKNEGEFISEAAENGRGDAGDFATLTDDKAKYMEVGKGKEREVDNSEGPKPSMLRILEIRAETIAETLLAEYLQDVIAFY